MQDSVEEDSVAATLRALRLAAGLTQTALAERAGLSERTIQDIERGISQPRRETMSRILDALKPAPETRALFESASPTPRQRRHQATDDRRSAHGGEPGQSGSSSGSVLTAPSPDRQVLPASLTSFVGRERELAILRRLLETRRLVTLTGPGGCGKTRLALELASQSADRFPGGVIFVSLAALGDPTLVVSAIAEALGVRETPRRPLIESVSAEIGERTVLLVLDNLEHLLPAAPSIGQMLAACPHLTILATSRELLRLAGEQVYAVPPLAVPAADDLSDETGDHVLATLSDSESVRLFTDRAQHAKPSFRLDRRAAGLVAEICRRLDGLPLAIELAAARVRHLPLEVLRDRLDERLMLLTDGPRDAPERHRTLRDTIAWSYGLLNEGEQALFRRLAVFAGGFTIEAAEAVAGRGPGALDADRARRSSPAPNTRDTSSAASDDVLDGLASLVDKCLLRPMDGAGTRPRYNMLDTILAYAREQLSHHGELAQMRAMHAAFFLQLAEAADPCLRGPNQAVWLARLHADLDNFRAALTWSRADERREDMGLRLAGALASYWWLHGYFDEGRRWLERICTEARHSHRQSDGALLSVRAKVLDLAGVLAHHQGELAVAWELFRLALELARRSDDPSRIGWALQHLGLVDAYRGRYRDAARACAESVALRRRRHDTIGVAIALVPSAIAAWYAGDLQGAVSFATESRDLFNSLDDRVGEAYALRVLGAVRWRTGDVVHGERLCSESLLMFRELGNARGMALALLALAAVTHHTKGWQRALVLYHESLQCFSQVGDRWGMLRCLEGIGILLIAQPTPTQPVLVRAARLLGAVEHLSLVLDAPTPVPDRVDYARAAEVVARGLAPQRRAVEWGTGGTMSLDEAVTYALGEPELTCSGLATDPT